MEDAGDAVDIVVGGVDLKSDSPLLGHFGKGGQQAVLGNLMLALERIGRRPFRHWSLLLCFPQTEKKEEKSGREPRNQEEQLHDERNEHFPEEIQPVLLVTLKVFAFDYCDC